MRKLTSYGKGAFPSFFLQWFALFFGIIAVAQFGRGMDNANFPGTGLELKPFETDKPILTWDGKNTGKNYNQDNKITIDGYRAIVKSQDIKVTCTGSGDCLNDKPIPISECNSLSTKNVPCIWKETKKCTTFIEIGSHQICDQEMKKKDDVTHGWVVLPKCDQKDNECTLFEPAGTFGIIGLGLLGCATLAKFIGWVLTYIEEAEKKKEAKKSEAKKSDLQEFINKHSCKKDDWDIFIFVCITLWFIIVLSMIIASAIMWQGAMDKLNTGIGNHFQGTPEDGFTLYCKTEQCYVSFTDAFALVTATVILYITPAIVLLLTSGSEKVTLFKIWED